MKNKKWSEKPYKKLIHKIFMQTFVVLTLAVIIVFLIRSAGQGKIGNFITRFYCSWYDTDWETAKSLYRSNVRQYMDYILIGTMLIFFLIFFRIVLSLFTKHYDEIIDGINELSASDDKPIVMSSELGFVEQKLNQVKDELERSAKAEHEAEKRKNDLIIYLAHDIKTPLTSVIGYLSLMEETPDMPPDQKAKYVHITLEKACRLERLINEFFEITRYNLHSVPLEKQIINLHHMMLQIADESYPLLSSNHKTVSTDIPDGFLICADPEKMARVFNNLLKNAIFYSDDQSVIEISAKRENDMVLIQFKNPGYIPDEKLPSIFEKFYRMDESRQSATGGSGLGLAIAKDIITLHNGTITAACRDRCIIFTIHLPGNFSK